MRKNFAAALPRTVALGLLTAGLAAPAEAVITPSLNGWRWARKGTLDIDVGLNVSAAWKPYVAPVLAGWSKSPYLDLDAATGRARGSSCNPVYGTIQVCNGNYGANGWLGYGNVWLQAGRIVMGNVRLNDYYFAQPRYNTPGWRQQTLCHEIGHTLGLDHSDLSRANDNIGSCMDYSYDPTGRSEPNGPRSNLLPGYPDLTGLAVLYKTSDRWQLVQTMTGVVGEGFAVVPEPGVWAQLLTGFGLLGGLARRRRRLTGLPA